MRKIIPPNTAAWINARKGLLTASRMGDVFAVSKRDAKPLKAREDLLVQLAAEKLTGEVGDSFVSQAMLWGIDQEPNAVEAYSVATGNLCEQAGLMIHPNIPGLGATPDRFVGDDGLLEVKCPTSVTHIHYLIAGTLPDEYAPQVHTQLAVSGREWCDFVSYDPRMPEFLQLMIVRVMRDEAQTKRMEAAAMEFIAEVAALCNQLLERKAAA